ncbi:MAG TPA: response regulator [Euzebya sp.]|nr:response regulator [Euzebya sp.]
MNILMVADHSSVAAQVKGAVQGWADSTVFHVSTPQRALALLDEGRTYDVVVADNDTHPTGGFALCREVKARGQMGRDVPPVLLLIARSQDSWLSDWAQADAYALKPADPFDLREALEAIVSGQPVPALPGIGGQPKASLLDRPPERELAAATGVPGRPDEGPPDELSATGS